MEIGKEASAPASASAWGATLIRLPVATRQNQILIPNQTADGQHGEHCEDSLLCLPNLELFNLRRDCRLCLLLLCLLVVLLLPLLLLPLLQLCSSVFVAVSVASVCVASAGLACLLSPASDISMFASHSALPFLLATSCSSFPSSSCFSFFPFGKLCSVCFSRGSSRWQRLSPRGQWPVPVGVEHVFCSSSGGLFVPVPPSLLLSLSSPSSC